MTARPSFFGIAVLLGLLSAIGPFAIDMYLPALPAMGASLQADVGTTQLTLTVFFVAIGVGQLLYGPLSDRFGRKPPLYVGLALFAVASVGCAMAESMSTLIAWRFLQGLGAAAGTAIPRAVVRDLHTGTEAARLMSLLMLVFGVSPILAPLIGSGVIAVAGWRAVFWAVAAAAVAGIVMMAWRLPETHPAGAGLGAAGGGQAGQTGPTGVLAGYGRLLRDRHYLGVVFIGATAMTGFFVYLSASPFVLIQHYGLSPATYGVVFGVNAIAFLGAAQFNGWLCDRFGLVAVIRFGVAATVLVMMLMFLYYASGGDRLAVLVVLYFVASAFMALVIPTTSVLALESHGPIAGSASALMGTLQMLTGAAGMGLVGLFNDGRPLPMVTGMAAGVMLAWLLTSLTLGGDKADKVDKADETEKAETADALRR